jgi:hypothetical protein
VARKQVIELIDDIDGSEAAQTVSFAFLGTSYEIDLSERNVDKFSKALAPYLENARKVRSPRGRSQRSGGVAVGVEPAVVRQWAVENGIEVNARGRVPAQLVERYLSAVG